MAKRMLIDAAHAEETRVVVVDGSKLEEFDFESANKALLKGNVYLAKVTRVEPSLQAAFVEYGGNRHGFLAFSEIHPDYYQIPVADRQALERQAAEAAASADSPPAVEDGADPVETVSGQEEEEIAARRPSPLPRYRIQEVVKRRQILLVQVTKEERGGKGAALTTYISLAGRYCVLMPNTTRGGGISRKIQSADARKRLRSIVDSLDLPDGMAVILRTAGQSRTKAEIKRDYQYLLRLWEQIRDRTLASTAPALIHEEANLIKRSIRDLYRSEIDEVLVEGDEGYRTAKKFMGMLMPSHARRVQPYRDASPIFTRHQVEGQLDSMHGAEVKLPSGGSIVLNPTEALVAIDVNSGRSTRERGIEETALGTNLEAADEIARQLRLRDLAGLIVVDFIDMDEGRNARAVERRLKEAARSDRARIQMGRISGFGLLELSRQRLRPSVQEIGSVECPHCAGSGLVRSTESAALHALRAIEEEGVRGRAGRVRLTVPSTVALYLVNRKRAALGDAEARYGLAVEIATDDSDSLSECRVETLEARAGEAPPPAAPADAGDAPADAGDAPARRSRGRRKPAAPVDSAPAEETPAPDEAAAEDGESGGEDRPRRRRGRRGGRRRARARAADIAAPEAAAPEAAAEEAAAAEEVGAEETPPPADPPEPAAAQAAETPPPAPDGEDSIVRPKRRRRTRKARAGGDAPAPAAADSDSAAAAPGEPPAVEAAPDAPAPCAPEKPKRRRRKKAEAVESNGGAAPKPESEPPAAAEAPPAPEELPEPPPRAPRRGWWSRAPGA